MWAIVLEETGSPMEETVNIESRCGIIRASFRVYKVVDLSWNRVNALSVVNLNPPPLLSPFRL